LAKRIGYDEIFKSLFKWYFEPYGKVITDYEIIDLPKKADIVVFKEKTNAFKDLTLFSYFKAVNGIEFKSISDSYKVYQDLYKTGIYINGILHREKIEHPDQFTFTIISSRHPQKLLKNFEGSVEVVEKGHYLLKNASLCDLHLIVASDLAEKRLPEYHLINTFSGGQKRNRFLDYLVNNIGDHIINRIIGYAMTLYKTDLITKLQESGKMQTVVEKNMNELMDLFGLKKQYINQGLEQGLERGVLQTAQKMLSEGIALETVQKITGLTKKQLKQLRKNN
jgi:predicted transposase/invertase (TIGR01784 family)